MEPVFGFFFFARPAASVLRAHLHGLHADGDLALATMPVGAVKASAAVARAGTSYLIKRSGVVVVELRSLEGAAAHGPCAEI